MALENERVGARPCDLASTLSFLESHKEVAPPVKFMQTSWVKHNNRGEAEMFARVTKYRMKPESMDDATSLVEQLKPQIMSMPGLHQFINVADENGNGYVISLVESRETSDANQGQVQAIWSKFADYLAEAPTAAEGFDVIVNERN